MFGFFGMKQKLRRATDRVFIACASAAFMTMAMVAIQYEELVAPEVARASGAWGSATTDLGRRLAGLAS